MSSPRASFAGYRRELLRAGGGIQSGQVVGASDKIGAYPKADPFDPVDVHATIDHLMGVDLEQHMYDNLGRPFPLTTGRPIAALV